MKRHLEPEIMDDLALDESKHVRALRGLSRINRWSRSPQILWPSIQAIARDSNLKVLRVLDLATGAGDVPIRLWQKARRCGLRLEIDGCDRSPRAVRYAQESFKSSGAEASFFPWDALEGPLPSGYDILISSLFLHHLDREQAVGLLRRMGQAARHGLVVNDLARSKRGWALAVVGTRLLSSSEVVHTDGPRSVRAAYTVGEARAMADEAGLSRATVVPVWPCRFLLTGRAC